MNTQIQTLSFDTLPVQFSSDAFLNATAIAKHFKKRAQHYLDSDRTKEYIDALAQHLAEKSKAAKTAFNEKQLVIVKSGAPETGGGTWLHPKLAIDFARWLNPKFAVWCDEQIENLLSGKLKAADKTKTKTAKLGCLTIEQQDEIKKFHRQLVQSAPKDKQAALAIGLWSAVKTKFGVSYKQVAEAHYPEVLSLMARVAVEKGALSGEVLDKEPELPVAALNDYELTRIAQFLSQSYSMMTELYIVQEPMNMLRLPFGQKALQYLKDNLPLLQAVVHGLQRFRPTDPICAPEFNKHMQYLSRAGLPV